jgi:ketosteroid isomerase-like protein
MPRESTTPDPMELVRGAFEAANRRDVDALMAFFAPDALLDATRTVGVACRGRAAIRGLVEDWIGAHEELEWVAEEPVDLGNGVVFAVVSQKASPVGVTGYVEQREEWVWVWVDDLIASQTIYPEADIDEARAAAERLAHERAQADV